MLVKNSRTVIKGLKNSAKAKSENNDCVVRAMATALDINYDTAHDLVANDMDRVSGKGTQDLAISNAMSKYIKDGLEVDGMKFNVSKCADYKVKNYYNLYGERIARQKTVKSFIKDNPKGTYMVLVSKHAFTVKDGTLIDNVGEEWRPTRKVQRAFQFTPLNEKKDVQLKLF